MRASQSRLPLALILLLAGGLAAADCLPSHDGFLRGRIRGAHSLDLDWRDAELECDGGQRPRGEGIRLTFAGRAGPTGRRLRFIFGIPGARGIAIAHDLATNVTVIFEGEGKLYSTAGTDRCTIDELRQEPLPAPPSGRVRVTARGFCLGTAGASDLGEGVLLSRFDFAGLIRNQEP